MVDPAPSEAEPLLAGVRVLDLSNYTPGPFGTQILADLGATVLKVERPPHGDLERLSVIEYFHAYNRGKYSIALDLHSDDDRQTFHRLVRDTDVVVEGFRPGVADRIGAGFAELTAIKPDLIYVSIPGVPSSSEFWMDRAHDSEFQARIGAIDFMAAGGAPSLDTPYPVGDYAAGMYAVIGILAALARRGKDAVRFEAPCFSAGLAWMYPMLCRLVFPMGKPTRGRLPAVGVFKTADDRYITMSTIEDRGWVSLCEAIARPDLASDPGLATLTQRVDRFDELDGVLREAIASRTMAEWEQILRDREISVGPILTPQEAVSDPLVRSLGLLGDEQYPSFGLPLYGITTVRHYSTPKLDQDGPAVRDRGWEALIATNANDRAKKEG